MLQLIKKATDHQISIEQADMILTSQEESGMLPPSMFDKVAICDDRGTLRSMNTIINEWEKE